MYVATFDTEAAARAYNPLAYDDVDQDSDGETVKLRDGEGGGDDGGGSTRGCGEAADGETKAGQGTCHSPIATGGNSGGAAGSLEAMISQWPAPMYVTVLAYHNAPRPE